MFLLYLLAMASPVLSQNDWGSVLGQLQADAGSMVSIPNSKSSAPSQEEDWGSILGGLQAGAGIVSASTTVGQPSNTKTSSKQKPRIPNQSASPSNQDATPAVPNQGSTTSLDWTQFLRPAQPHALPSMSFPPPSPWWSLQTQPYRAYPPPPAPHTSICGSSTYREVSSSTRIDHVVLRL